MIDHILHQRRVLHDVGAVIQPLYADVHQACADVTDGIDLVNVAVHGDVQAVGLCPKWKSWICEKSSERETQLFSAADCMKL